MGKGARLRAVNTAVPKTDVVTIAADKYWELRCRLSEHAGLIAQCNRQVAESQAHLDALQVSAGLDPSVGYNLDDATLSATPR